MATTRPATARSRKPAVLTARRECAIRIAAGILAGPSGGKILNSTDPDAITKLARVAVKFADALLEEVS